MLAGSDFENKEEIHFMMMNYKILIPLIYILYAGIESPFGRRSSNKSFIYYAQV